MEGLDRVPWKGELGQRIYENVSKEAWKMWIEHSKMIMNEYRLNPARPAIAKDHGRAAGAVLLRRRRQAARRLRSAASQGLAPDSFTASPAAKLELRAILRQALAPRDAPPAAAA